MKITEYNYNIIIFYTGNVDALIDTMNNVRAIIGDTDPNIIAVVFGKKKYMLPSAITTGHTHILPDFSAIYP